jgi:TDG/mug DNA glycosylase family protein
LPNGRKPSREEIAAAYGKRIPDVIASGLKVLFCGINPSLYSAAVGCHFARPGNRFWPAMHAGGFTDRILTPIQQRRLLDIDCGITNIVGRATATAAELSREDFVKGGRRLKAKTQRYRPRCVAFLGITAFRAAFGQSQATLGLQPDKIGDSSVWVLPNPSGLNAHYQLRDLARLFAELRTALTP